MGPNRYGSVVRRTCSAATRAASCSSSIRIARKFLQSNQIFSCSLPCRCRISDASSSNERSNSPPRSSNSAESGPANSTRISGCSHSRFCAIGGSTVIRYFSLKPPLEMTACRNSPICFAAAILSVIGISEFSAFGSERFAFSLLAFLEVPKLRRKKPKANHRQLLLFFPRPLLHHRAHLAPERRAIHHRLLHDPDQLPRGPVQTESSRQVPAHDAQHARHHDVHHLLLRRIHTRLRRHALHDEHRDDD